MGWTWMEEISLWKKLSLKVWVETKMVIAVVIVVVIVVLIGTMVVDVEVEVEVENVLSVASLGILQGSVLVKGAEEVSMGGGMTGMEEEEEEEEVAVGAMVLIEMVIDLVVAIGKVVVEEDQEMTAIIGTVLVPMNVVVQETSVQGRKNTPDSKQLEVLLLLAGGVKVSPVASLLHGCLGGRIGLISL